MQRQLAHPATQADEKFLTDSLLPLGTDNLLSSHEAVDDDKSAMLPLGIGAEPYRQYPARHLGLYHPC
jgi:hypothetical protein